MQYGDMTLDELNEAMVQQKKLARDAGSYKKYQHHMRNIERIKSRILGMQNEVKDLQPVESPFWVALQAGVKVDCEGKDVTFPEYDDGELILALYEDKKA